MESIEQLIDLNKINDIQIEYTPYKEELLDPNMPNLERVGRHARICYRTPIPTGVDEKTFITRIISKCINDGHTSILEHAAISLVVSDVETTDMRECFYKLVGKRKDNPISVPSMMGILRGTAPESQDKYIRPYFDDTVLIRHAKRMNQTITPQMKKGSQVLLGDARAWRDVISDRFMMATHENSPVPFLAALRLLHAMYKCEPVFFQDLYDRVNKMLSMIDRKKLEMNDHIQRIIISRITTGIEKDEKGEITKADPLTLDDIINFFFSADEFFAEQSCPSAVFSMIIDTDRTVTHQHVRHRQDVGYSQESQRYVNYEKKGYAVTEPFVDPAKLSDEIREKLIEPGTNGVLRKDSRAYKLFDWINRASFLVYEELLHEGLPPETARRAFTNAVATRIGVTWLAQGGFSNFVHWRNEKHAQFDIRALCDRIITGGLATDHPFLKVYPPALILEWLQNMKDQKMVSDDTANLLMDAEKARMEERRRQLEEYVKARKAAAEAEIAKAKEAEANRVKAQAEAAAQQESPAEAPAAPSSETTPTETK